MLIRGKLSVRSCSSYDTRLSSFLPQDALLAPMRAVILALSFAELGDGLRLTTVSLTSQLLDLRARAVAASNISSYLYEVSEDEVIAMEGPYSIDLLVPERFHLIILQFLVGEKGVGLPILADATHVLVEEGDALHEVIVVRVHLVCPRGC